MNTFIKSKKIRQFTDDFDEFIAHMDQTIKNIQDMNSIMKKDSIGETGVALSFATNILEETMVDSRNLFSKINDEIRAQESGFRAIEDIALTQIGGNNR